jgi:hypothetical protein
VVQHLFRSGDGLANHGSPNGTQFETSGLIAHRGVVLAFVAVGCQGKHSGVICGQPLAGYGTSMIGLRRSTDSAKMWGPLIVINTSITSMWDESAGAVPVADNETGYLFVCWARKSLPWAGKHKVAQDAWVAHSTDLGLSWSKPANITPSVGPGHLVGLGSYGHGVQVRAGAHKGRLLVQFYGVGSGRERAWFYYSDDHGIFRRVR